MNGNNENSAKYMIFSPSGEMPTNTLAAIEDEHGIQIIINGSGGNIIKLFGSLCKALNEGDAKVDTDTLKTTVDTACSCGAAWEFICRLMEKAAKKGVENGETLDESFENMWSGLMDMLGNRGNDDD